MREKIATGEIYHVYNRGVEKRNIFLDNHDYLRFIHDLFEFNDIEPADRYYLPSMRSRSNISEVRLPKIERQPRKFLVDVLCFCLMPNHFHLMLQQRQENGISEFIRKIGTGYTHYFNKRHERSGVLFQGKYKYIRVFEEPHFMYLPYYIHLNPLDLYEPGWRYDNIKSSIHALKFLETYKWSSYPDYIGKKNFPSVTQREFLTQFFDGPSQYKQGIQQWLEERQTENVEHLTLE